MYSRIRDLREDRDMTQAQLAAMVGVSQRAFSDYERGRLDVPTDILKKLAAIFECSIDYLVEIEEAPPEKKKPRGKAPRTREAGARKKSINYKILLSQLEALNEQDRQRVAELLKRLSAQQKM